MSQLKRTGFLIAEDDDGTPYEIIEYTEFVPVGRDGATVEGLKEYRLTNGDNLNRLSDIEFEIVLSGKHLHLSS